MTASTVPSAAMPAATMTAPAMTDVAMTDAAREGLLERHAVEIAGRCETCDRLLFAGERGHREADDSGILTCDAHAPTWEDAADIWHGEVPEPGTDDEHADARLAFDEAYAAHLAAGGQRTDKLLVTL